MQLEHKIYKPYVKSFVFLFVLLVCFLWIFLIHDNCLFDHHFWDMLRICFDIGI